MPELLGKEDMRPGLILNQDKAGGIKEGCRISYYAFIKLRDMIQLSENALFYYRN
jgi:hypothetical protein